MKATPERIAADRARLAELEAELDAGSTRVYLRENIASYRRRVAHYEDAASVPLIAGPSTEPARASRPAPVVTATRDERLKRLATAYGADSAMLENALASDITPDAFALALVERKQVDEIAARIAAA